MKRPSACFIARTLVFCVPTVAGLHSPPAAAQCPPLEGPKLLADDGSVEDAFGLSVAMRRDYAICGAYYVADGTGAAYVFKRTAGQWAQQARLTIAGGMPSDLAARAVAIDDDVAVLNSEFDDEGAFDAGAAYVFERSGTVWAQVDKLIALDAADDANLGHAVAVFGDTIVVGAPGDSPCPSDPFCGAGSAYVFVRSQADWVQQAKLIANDAAADADFGWSVAVFGDMAVIGAPGDDGGRGAAYVFTRSGTTWTQEIKLTDVEGSLNDALGWSVAVSGGTVAAGSPQANSGAAASGVTVVFAKRDGDWSTQARLMPDDPLVDGRFGWSVATDGGLTLVGTPGDDAACAGDPFCDSGAAYLFARSLTTWSPRGKLRPADSAGGDQFGVAVALSDGAGLIGSPLDDDLGSVSGSAYIFRAGAPRGDMNCDCAANVLDINSFVLALLDPADYAALHPFCRIEAGDINGDGRADVLDINDYVALLLSGG
ncbi:hypothetical protein RAS1_43820 [Phycisphaerae bacterium RAS1]|nr:hypothetical protein RAS1_43820 [Phycisphaerae bacterium RAS1]